MYYLGDFLAGSTVRGMWNTNAVAGESITRATNGTIKIYKDNSTTERTSSNGITDTEDFDSLTGVHHYAIDLSDNTDDGFYAAGHDYFVVLSGATIDGKAINSLLGVFSIENRNIKANVTQFGGTNLTASGGIPEVKVSSLAAAALASIWDALTSGMSTSGSIGKLISDNLDAQVSTRLPTSDITLTGGKVTVGTNDDKTGYALSGSGVSAVQSGLATSTEVMSVQNNTRCVRSVPHIIERPDSGTATYRVELCLYDEAGNMEAPDSAPTIALVNQAGDDLSSRLDSTTMSLVSTGKYRAIYTASDTDDLEQLNWAFTVVENSQTREYINQSLIVDTTAVDFTAADRTKLVAVYDDWADGGRLDNILDARASQSSVNSTPSNVWNYNGFIGPETIGASLQSAIASINTVYLDLVDGGRLDAILDGIKAKTDLISEIYHADVDLRIDDANSRDNYRVTWKKDGERIVSAITDPTIQVVKADESDLIAETAMTANVYTFTYQATGDERLTAGQSVEVVVTATINGGTRTFSAVVGRDSE